MDLTKRAQEVVEQALAARTAKQQIIAAKVASAEALAEKIEEINALQEAVDDVIENDINALHALAKKEKQRLQDQKKALLAKNSEFAERAAALMSAAGEIIGKQRKSFLKNVGSVISTVKGVGGTIITEIKAGM